MEGEADTTKSSDLFSVGRETAPPQTKPRGVKCYRYCENKLVDYLSQPYVDNHFEATLFLVFTARCYA